MKYVWNVNDILSDSKIKFVFLIQMESTKLKSNFNTYIFTKYSNFFNFFLYHFSSIIVNDHKFIHFIVFSLQQI